MTSKVKELPSFLQKAEPIEIPKKVIKTKKTKKLQLICVNYCYDERNELDKELHEKYRNENYSSYIFITAYINKIGIPPQNILLLDTSSEKLFYWDFIEVEEEV